MSNSKSNVVAYENMPSAFDLHSTLSTQAGVNKIELQEIMPKHSIESTGPIEFIIPSGAHQSIDPKGMLLELTVQVRKGDGTLLKTFDGATAKEESWVIPANHLASSLFKDMEIRINNRQINKTDGLYAYRADFAARLNTSAMEKENILSLAAFSNDETKKWDITPKANIASLVAFDKKTDAEIIAHDGDAVLNNRWIKSRDSQSMELVTPLYGELFQQVKYLPPRTTLGITLYRNDPKYFLLTKQDGDYRLHITKANLLVKMVDIEEKMVQEMEFFTYQGNDMIYPIQRVQIGAFSKSAGSLDLSIPDLFLGSVVPRRIFVSLLRSQAFYGTYELDPFNYSHFNVKEISLKINGSTSRLRPIRCDYARKNYTQAVVALLNATNCISGENDQIGINKDNFINGNVIYGFDPSGLAAGPMADSFVKEEKGVVGLEIHCERVLTEEIMILVYCEFDSEIRINKEGIPSVDEFA